MSSAIVAAAAAIIAALLTTLANTRANERTRSASAAEHDKDRAHELDLKRLDQDQERWARTYEARLDAYREFSLAANRTRRQAETTAMWWGNRAHLGRQKPIDTKAFDDSNAQASAELSKLIELQTSLADALTVVQVVASSAVHDAAVRFAETLRETDKKRTIAAQAGPDGVEEWQTLTEAQKQLSAAEMDLREAIRSELDGRKP